MDPVVVADTRIGSSEFGDFQYTRFVLWSFLVRQSKGGFLRNIAVARTEANEPNIQQTTAYYCDAYGISEKELIRRVLEADAQGVSIVELHRRLEEEAEDNPNADLSLLPKRQQSRTSTQRRQQRRGRSTTPTDDDA